MASSGLWWFYPKSRVWSPSSLVAWWYLPSSIAKAIDPRRITGSCWEYLVSTSPVRFGWVFPRGPYRVRRESRELRGPRLPVPCRDSLPNLGLLPPSTTLRYLSSTYWWYDMDGEKTRYVELSRCCMPYRYCGDYRQLLREYHWPSSTALICGAGLHHTKIEVPMLICIDGFSFMGLFGSW